MNAVPAKLAAAVVAGALLATLAVAARADVFSGTDAVWTRSALKAAEASRWKVMRRQESRVKHVLARKLLTWRRLVSAPAGTTFAEVDRFVGENPDWPRRGRLLRQAEKLMAFGMAPDQTLRWFGERGPLSAAGRMRMGAALIATGETATGRGMIRRAWIDGNFPRADEKMLYRRFRRLLERADHIERMDRLLWDGKASAARRMLYRVPLGWRKLAQARTSLRRRHGNVDALISRVPTELSGDLGLVYERLRWRRRKNKDNAVDLLRGLPDELPRAELWWREKSALARRTLRKGYVSEAYRMAKAHRLSPGGPDYAEAEWLAGWIALRFLRDYPVAQAHFERLHAAVQYPISLARAAYWAGRAAEANGDDETAVTWYRRAAEHPLVYYGQLAVARLRPGGNLSLPETFAKAPDEEQAKAFERNELVGVVRILNEVGQRRLIRPFVLRLYELSDSPAWRAMTAELARDNGRPDLAILVAKRASRAGQMLLDVGYPSLKPPKLPKTAKVSAPEVPLTMAVIRQESAFRIDAQSPANARGLMQIIPPTAKRVAKGLRMRFSRVRLVSDPKYNLTLGQSYLGSLIEEFKGSYVLALAAYNAGPPRARAWIKANGDPRAPDVDAIDWVEMIPFYETRNYVQRVLENLQVYRVRLSETEIALALNEDLHISEN